jgi:hypothetical protein
MIDRRTAWLAALLLFAGGHDAAVVAQEVAVRDSAGITIVESSAPAWAAGEGWTAEAEPEVSIGGADAQGPYALHRVRGAARLPDGTLAVSDGGSGQMRLFTPDGSFVNALGRRGSGPGEFSGPTQVFAGRADTVIAWDPSRMRIHWFRRDGTAHRAVAIDRPFTRQMGGSVPVDTRLLPDLGVLVELRELAPVAGAGDRVTRPLHRALWLPRGAQAWDTVRSFPGAEEMGLSTPRVRIALSTPHARRGRIAAGGNPSRLCVGSQETAEITCFDAAGAERRVRWAAAPVPVGRAEITAWRERTLVEDRSLPGSVEARRRAVDAMPMPAYRPPYDRIVLDYAGNLWAEVPRALDAPPDAPITYLVFNPEGAWLGEVVVPAMELLEIGPEYILGLSRDAYDAEIVQRFRLDRRAGNRR